MPLSGLLLAVAVSAPAADRVSIPARANLDLILAAPIDERATPQNQQIAFKFARDLKANGKVLVPKNTPLTARITLTQKGSAFIRNTKRAYFIVGLRLESVDFPDGAVPVGGALETVGPATPNDYFVPFSHGPDKWGEMQDYRFVFKLPDPQPGESFLGVVREYLRVPAGLRMVFRTPESQP